MNRRDSTRQPSSSRRGHGAFAFRARTRSSEGWNTWKVITALMAVTMTGCAKADSRPDTSQLRAPSSVAPTAVHVGATSSDTLGPSLVEGFPNSVSRRLIALDSATLARLTTTTDTNRTRVKSIIVLTNLFNAGEPITVAFNGGATDARAEIIRAAREWSRQSGVTFDFGPNSSSGRLREWTPGDRSYAAMIRIGFEPTGYWSYVGTESVSPEYAPPGSSSLNLQGMDRLPFRYGWEGTVLHEFGHALGLLHEHQNPLGICETEFLWNDDPGYVPSVNADSEYIRDPGGRRPSVYRYLGGPPNNWDTTKVNFNLRRLLLADSLVASDFDRLSIMQYALPALLLKNGSSSSCFARPTTKLSSKDVLAAREFYGDGGGQQLAPSLRSIFLHGIIDTLKVPAATKERLRREVVRVSRALQKE